MGCLGVHFAITDEHAQALINAPDDKAVMALVEEIEESTWEAAVAAGLLAETDKAWDAIHRAMTDGQMTWDGGEEPLKWVILGGRIMYTSGDYIVTLIDPSQVQQVAEALKTMDKEAFRKRYDELVPEDHWPGKGGEYFDYTWHWFDKLNTFYQTAAKANRHVIFTADQ